jgi:hypothetical protein
VGAVAIGRGYLRLTSPDPIPRDPGLLLIAEPKDPNMPIAEFDKVMIAAGARRYLRPATAHDRLRLSGSPADLARLTHVGEDPTVVSSTAIWKRTA